jgi:predicted metalloprotease with PDZ domain
MLTLIVVTYWCKRVAGLFKLPTSKNPEFMLLRMKSPVTCFVAIGLVALAVFAQCASGQAKAEDQSQIHYSIDFSESQNHYLHITARFPVGKNKTELMMATWAPGSYLIREYARHVDSLSMADETGNEINFAKTKKNRWLAETKGIKTLVVKYRLYCNEMTVRTNWTGRAFSMINGAPTFITPVGSRNQDHYVELKLPKNWKRSSSVLPTTENPHEYVADSFDTLVDSPIVAGNVAVYPFDVDGVPHQLVNVGESGYWDGAKAAADLKKMVTAHHEMWGVVPYEKYLFINVIGEAGGGLEHDNCTLIMTSRWSFRKKDRYLSWLSLASHEFFHTWNVRRLRPKTLVRYDYENEMYTESLWIAEGITSYYEDLLLVRSGLFDRAEFLKRLSKNVESVQKKEGRKIQSLTDSSFDTWIKFYRPDENSSNTRISYYAKGAVAAFLLDVEIRKLTKGKKSLDDVMRKMYEDFVDSGYTPDDFRKTASEVAGKDLDDWFKRSIDSTEELDYSRLPFVGVEIKGLVKPDKPRKKSSKKKSKKKAIDETKKKSKEKEQVEEAKAADADSEKLVSKVESEKESIDPKDKSSKEQTKPPVKPWTGISGSASGNSVVVSSITPDSPGYDAGIQTGDELIAINEFRLSGSLGNRLDQFEVEEPLEFLIARRGQLIRLDVTPRKRDSMGWKLSFIKKPSKKQKRQLKKWLD